jgi:predicted pyridoxine 5'-phosphate oxidase superfamily flavin-nucleotide-binding protein
MPIEYAPFHAGEIEVQQRAGNPKPGDGHFAQRTISGTAGERLAAADLAILTLTDGSGQPWAWPLAGEPGMVQPEHDRLVPIRSEPSGGERLREQFAAGRRAGMVAFVLEAPARARVNGSLVAHQDGLAIAVEEAFGNCPKYIQSRHGAPAPAGVAAPQEHAGLLPRHRRLIARADTLFISTRSADGRLDASHRGGQPGFIRLDGDELQVADYPGNRKFQTLGNVAQDARACVVLIDFATSAWLQLIVHARLEWRRPDARVLRLRVEGVVEHPALPRRWALIERSPHNPPPDAGLAV